MTSNSDNEWSMRLQETDYSCQWSGETIAYGEGVVSISVMVANRDHEGLFLPNFAVTPDKDDLLWEPQFFSVCGWEDIQEKLREELEEQHQKPSAATGYSLCYCKYCHSGIQNGEVLVLLTFGEIHRSQRMPNGRGMGSATFQAMDSSPTIMCVACHLVMHNKITSIWSDHVTQHEECEAGTAGRCWRHGCEATARSCDISRMNTHGTRGR